jgi:hypothetical protein
MILQFLFMNELHRLIGAKSSLLHCDITRSVLRHQHFCGKGHLLETHFALLISIFCATNQIVSSNGLNLRLNFHTHDHNHSIFLKNLPI